MFGWDGVGLSKSFVGPLWLAKQISEHPGEIWLVLAPSYRILSAATIPNLLTHFQGTNLEGTYNLSRNQYMLPDGGIIHFISTDNPQAAQGVVAAGAWLDEGGLSSYDAWVTIQQRVGFKQGKILLTTTPYGPGWLFDIIEKGKKGESDYCYINMKSIDNPYYPLDEYERAKKDLPAYLFEMRYNGLFGTPENAVYFEFNDENIAHVEYNGNLPLYVGSDFNSSDLSWVIGQKVGDHLNIIDEIYIKYNATTQVALDELWRRYGSHANQWIFCGDASSKAKHASATLSDYEQIERDKRFQNRRICYPDANPAVQDRIACVSGLVKNSVRQRRLSIDPKCQRTILDIRQSRYLQGTREVDKKSWDPHAADALGYLAWALFPIIPYTINNSISIRKFK